jgi:hypothetical protein
MKTGPSFRDRCKHTGAQVWGGFSRHPPVVKGGALAAAAG